MSETANLIDTASRALRVVARRRWLALGAAAAVAVVCAVGVPMVPNRYEASAQVYVDTQTVLKPLMAGLAFQPDFDTQVRMLARTLVSRANVERLVSMPALGFDTADEQARQKLVTRLTERIKVVPVPAAAGNLYDISYRGESPEGARRVVNAIVQMFSEASSGEKRRDSADAGRFIEQQISSYEARLVEAEEQLKEFKVRNFSVTGVSTQDYYTRVSSLTDTVAKLRFDLSAAEQSRDAYRRELAAEDPQLPTEAAARGNIVPLSESEVRLEAQKRQLDELSRRYTDEHPDVVHARRVIAQLEADERARKQALASLAPKAGKAATNPVYQKLRISLAEAEAQVASTRAQLSMQQSQLDQTRASASQRPQVEAELAQLNRDYEVMRKNYDALVARRESASIGAKLGDSAGYAEFRVVEPPRANGKAVFPTRLHLALLSVVGCIAAGIGVALLAEHLWPGVNDTASLASLSGRQVLGRVSMLSTPQAALDRRRQLLYFGAVSAALLLLQGIWVAWVAMSPQPFA